MEGLWKYYYENGQLWKEGSYINGKEEGLQKAYYNNGTLLQESNKNKR